MESRTRRVSPGDVIIAVILGLALSGWAGILSISSASAGHGRTWTFLAFVCLPISACLLFLLMTSARWWKARWAAVIAAICAVLWFYPWHPRIRFFSAVSGIHNGMTQQEVDRVLEDFEIGNNPPGETDSMGRHLVEINCLWIDPQPSTQYLFNVRLYDNQVSSCGFVEPK